MASKYGRVQHSPFGLCEENRIILNKIGIILGAKFITCFGSRVNGNWVDDSDFDIVVHLPIEKRAECFEKKIIIEKELNIKIDMLVSMSYYPTNGVMIEIV